MLKLEVHVELSFAKFYCINYFRLNDTIIFGLRYPCNPCKPRVGRLLVLVVRVTGIHCLNDLFHQIIALAKI